MKRFLALVITCTTLSVDVIADQITVDKTAEDRFVLTLTSTEYYDVESSQYLLVKKAIELCGVLTPSFGRYSFENVEPLVSDSEAASESSYRFSQNVTCEEASESVAQEKTQQSFQHSSNSQIEESIRNVTDDYFEALSKGEFEAAWTHLTEDMQSYKSFPGWEKANEEFYRTVGDMVSSAVWRVTIYNNPPQAPRPGLYVAADYFNSYANAPFHCGYLIWYSDGESEFRIMREETGHVTSDVVEEMTGDQLEQVKAQFGCTAR